VDSEEAFIWDVERGMRSMKGALEGDFGLDLSGWTLVRATGVSSDGRTVVGIGVNQSNQIEAWLPSSLSPRRER
jgi:hypothetical protein